MKFIELASVFLIQTGDRLFLNHFCQTLSVFHTPLTRIKLHFCFLCFSRLQHDRAEHYNENQHCKSRQNHSNNHHIFLPPSFLKLTGQVLDPYVFTIVIHHPWDLAHFVQTGTRIYNEHRPVLFALIQIKVYGIAQEKAICFIGCPDTTSGDVSSFPKGTSPDINSIFFIYALIAFPV